MQLRLTAKLMYLMTAYYTPNDSFTASDAMFYTNKVGLLQYKLQCLQLIIYAIIKISIKGIDVPLYEFAAKQSKKGHKQGIKIFL